MKRLYVFLTVLFLFSSWGIASAIPINVANQYGTATANSFYTPHTPSLAIDDIIANDNYWNAGDHGTVSDPNWLVVDLGTSFNVTAIDLYFSPPDGLYLGFTTNYNVYFGDDNVSWNWVGTGQFVDEDPSKITDHFSFGSVGQSMRYVKYEVDGGTHWSSISEISIWADGVEGGGEEPVPEPATVLLFGIGLVGMLGFKIKKKKSKNIS
jgi:hypothetical protein